MESTPLKDTSGFDNSHAHGPSGPLTPDQAVIRKEMSTCVTEYIDDLPLDYETALVLSELKDLSNREIADILEISLDSVKIRLHRARAKLRDVLSDGCDFYHNEQNVLGCDRKRS